MINEKVIWTIGHSTHSIEHFIAMLLNNEIEVLIDVRSLPGSNKYPHFNQDRLEQSLADNNIKYHRISLLGGRRKLRKDSKNDGWRNKSFRAYADYMESDEFKKGVDELINYATHYRVAIMCAEVLWWRCHRAMISDYMKSMDWKVVHILDTENEKNEIHPYTSVAQIKDCKLTYHKEN